MTQGKTLKGIRYNYLHKDFFRLCFEVWKQQHLWQGHCKARWEVFENPIALKLFAKNNPIALEATWFQQAISRLWLKGTPNSKKALSDIFLTFLKKQGYRGEILGKGGEYLKEKLTLILQDQEDLKSIEGIKNAADLPTVGKYSLRKGRVSFLDKAQEDDRAQRDPAYMQNVRKKYNKRGKRWNYDFNKDSQAFFAFMEKCLGRLLQLLLRFRKGKINPFQQNLHEKIKQRFDKLNEEVRQCKDKPLTEHDRTKILASAVELHDLLEANFLLSLLILCSARCPKKQNYSNNK